MEAGPVGSAPDPRLFSYHPGNFSNFSVVTPLFLVYNDEDSDAPSRVFLYIQHDKERKRL